MILMAISWRRLENGPFGPLISRFARLPLALQVIIGFCAFGLVRETIRFAQHVFIAQNLWLSAQFFAIALLYFAQVRYGLMRHRIAYAASAIQIVMGVFLSHWTFGFPIKNIFDFLAMESQSTGAAWTIGLILLALESLKTYILFLDATGRIRR